MKIKKNLRKAREKSNARSGNAKEYVELLEDVNCIPKGVYALDEYDGESWVFRVKNKALCSISNVSEESFKKLSAKEAEARLTSVKDFTARYYQLVEAQRRRVWHNWYDPSRPVTMCMLDPSVAREVH